MKITYTGQVGLLIKTKTKTLFVDPYLCDTLRETAGEDYARMVPVDETLFECRPDMVLITHDHADHLDIPSLEKILDPQKTVQVLCAENAWKKARKTLGGHHNYVMMRPGTEWSTADVMIRAVPAVHSDATAVGYLIHADGKTLYVTGDTLYDEAVVNAIHESIDGMFVVMNGMGNNMNSIDAARMAEALSPKVVVPVHWGLFEKYSASPSSFVREAEKRGVNVFVAEICKEFDLESLWRER